MAAAKKPKKDEIVTLDGEIGDIFSNLIQIADKNISMVGLAAWERVKELELKRGDWVHATHKNGILQTIDPAYEGMKREGTDEDMHIENSPVSRLPVKTAEPVQPITSESVAIVSRSGDGPTPSADVHMQITKENIEGLMKGKTCEEICDIKEIFDKLVEDSLIKDTIQAFDDNRSEGAVVAEAEMTGIGSVPSYRNRYDGTIYEHGTRCDYKITLIIPETEEDKRERELREAQWEREENDRQLREVQE